MNYINGEFCFTVETYKFLKRENKTLVCFVYILLGNRPPRCVFPYLCALNTECSELVFKHKFLILIKFSTGNALNFSSLMKLLHLIHILYRAKI